MTVKQQFISDLEYVIEELANSFKRMKEDFENDSDLEKEHARQVFEKVVRSRERVMSNRFFDKLDEYIKKVDSVHYSLSEKLALIEERLSKLESKGGD